MASQENTAHAQPQAPLLDKLLAELRNTIWEYALTLDEPGEEGDFFSVKRFHTKTIQQPSTLSLLQVNKQIHNEAQGMFFRLQHPHFADTRDLKRFLRATPAKKLSGMSEIAVDVRGNEDLSFALRSLSLAKAKLPRLETLTIHFTRWSTDFYTNSPITFNWQAPRESFFKKDLLGKLPPSVVKIRLVCGEGLNAEPEGEKWFPQAERTLNSWLALIRRDRKVWGQWRRAVARGED